MQGGGRGLGDARLIGLGTSRTRCTGLPPEKAVEIWLRSVGDAVPEDEVVVPEAEPNSSVGAVSR